MNTFWFGWFTAFCAFGIHQDYYGLEGYLTVVREHWVNQSPWFWVGLWLLTVLSIVVMKPTTKIKR